MKFELIFNNKTLLIKVVKKKGMKNTYLRVKSAKMIQINTNYYFTKEDAINLLQRKQKWIENSISKFEINSLEDNEFYFLGVKHKNLDLRDLDKFYKKEVQKIVPPLVEKFSTIMNLYPTDLKYRKNKRTWGSCNYKNGLNFNTLLVKFPIEVIEYVVIHELAHIEHKNHSKKFWNLVEEYCPDYKQREKLLKSFL
ncbi:M48 family metallopeptidase [Arcobacter arenosus]|uniref:M48 family metallopeptidase n=1 Tax=Arcobacter arenosus TaxID=2576037 RepID=A0A5R8Y030_9BACT|nr:SprT family zinc-dependent metalloprotease [Arcobacter arenosus]TLP37611.1 M48 family metallopeptidase [Arcobacter arenosus]